VVAAVTALAVFFGAYLLFPVTGMEVKGARMFPEMEAWAALPNRASLLTLDEEAMERQIESNPWVKGAKVLKNRESGIVVVEVEERRAVLSGELGRENGVWAVDGTELPGLGEARLKRVELDEGRLEEILDIGEALEENGVRLDSVDRVDAGGVKATVEGRRVLFGGGVGAGQVRALLGIMEEHPEAPYFDLRSPERVVVGTEEGDVPSDRSNG
jgi:cell division protein FtsQ